MYSTPEQELKAYRKASKARQQEFKQDPEKAKQFLIDAGILVRSSTSKNGVELAKFYRPSKAS